MSTFVLIHGAWHGAWCWARVAPLLAAKGHRVVAPDSPGMGEDRTPFAEDVLAQWVDAAAAVVAAQADPVVLVGHSRGTVIVSAVAERVPDRVARAVYLCGAMLVDGECLMDVRAGSDEVLAAIVPHPGGDAAGLDPARAAGILYGLCTPDVAAFASARLIGEPVRVYGERLRLSPGRYGRVPRAYIEAAHDRAFPLSLQRETQTRWPSHPVVTLPSDHSPFLSMPEELADALDGLAR